MAHLDRKAVMGPRQSVARFAVVIGLSAYLIVIGYALSTSQAAPTGGSAMSTDLAAQDAVPAADDLTLGLEFNGPAGAGPNNGLPEPLWHTDGCWQAGCMGTLASYRPENALQDGKGSLALVARAGAEPGEICGAAGPCRFTTSRLTMLDWANGGAASWSQKGGRFEARIKSPVGNGLWPAFWTVGADQARVGWPKSGEINIFEAVGQRPNYVEQWIHGYSPSSTRDRGDDIHGRHTRLPGTDISGWHTYAIDWDPSPTTGYITWSIDGVTQNTVRAAEAGTMWQSVARPQTLILDLAVGGWADEPDPAVFPATMLVDYIRVYRSPQS